MTVALALLAMLTPQAPQDPVASIKAAIPLAEQDKDRPAFHFHPPAQWMNDPNGPIYYKGWYHVFYQHNPFGDQWGHMHWGHARSRDMVDWEHLPPAIAPATDRGEDHIYSGSTHLNKLGKPVIFYTSISDRRPPEQWAATPLDDDLIKWVQPANDPILSLKAHGDTKIDEWRDPFVFDNNDSTYMVTGGNVGGKGTVALYKAQDKELMDWKYVGILFHHPTANDVECPNFVKIGSKWVLLTSTFGQVDYFVGILEGDHFTAEHQGLIGDGSYASQIMIDKHGKPIHLAWVNNNDHKGWNGVMTLPSEMSVSRDGLLLRRPIGDLAKLRVGEPVQQNGTTFGAEPFSISRDSCEFQVDLDAGSTTLIKISWPGGQMTFDPRTRTLTIPQRRGIHLSGSGDLKVHGYCDREMLDFYVNDGEITFTTRFDRKANYRHVDFSAEGGNAKFKSFTLFELRGAKFEMKY